MGFFFGDTFDFGSMTVFGYELPFGGITLALLVVALVNLYFTIQSVKEKTAFDPDEWRSFKLIEEEGISHDVRRFRFALQSKDHIIGLPVGQHISFMYVDAEGKDVIRSYTPTTSNDEKGYVDFVIKVYYKNVHPNFPHGGKMSQHLASLKIGDTILMKGPKGHVDYVGNGNFSIKHKKDHITKHSVRKLGMIAGGTGITPMLQVIRAIIKNPKDKTELFLIFANQTEDDILLRKELESIPSHRLHIYYTLDRPNADWKYGKGFVNLEMCRAHLPPPGEDSFVFMCGPPPMIKFACEPALKELNYGEDQLFAF